MTHSDIAAIVLGAGKGTRMKSDLPKVMMPVCGKPMIRHILNTLESAGVSKIVTVIAPDGDLVKKEVAPYQTCVQKQQLGTGDAVKSAKNLLQGFTGDILVIFGDQPLYTKETISKLVNKRREGYSIVCLGFTPDDAARYGRLIMENGELKRIVEYKDANEEERAVRFCNSGMMCFDGSKMFDILDEITNENAAQEYYLTDAIAIALRKGLKCSAVECPVNEAAAANTREELAFLEELMKQRNGK
ncbi:MAG: NTP transferase domain-containing protein [Alphaproteobacteria bacterium]|nr:NTP transferase domain-containing protein [Alphaproteobacteria bacterium]